MSIYVHLFSYFLLSLMRCFGTIYCNGCRNEQNTVYKYCSQVIFIRTLWECCPPGWRMLQDVGSIYLWSCTSAFSAIEPSPAVSQGKLTSLLIALLVITECSWSGAVSSPGGFFSLRLSFSHQNNKKKGIDKLLSSCRACLDVCQSLTFNKILNT